MSTSGNVDPLTAILSARVLRPGPGTVSARIHLSYDSKDPYAVVMSVRLPGVEAVPWTFGRELLADGLRRTSGVGDVTIAPCPQAPLAMLHVTLRDDVSDAVMEVRLAPVAEFMRSAYALVPPGREGLFLLVENDVSALAS
jgi:Streptomyces sporulation and cell division protein, SsgA